MIKDKIVCVSLVDNLYLQIDTNNLDCLNLIKSSFDFFAENYRFMPRYKAGVWDGKISLFNASKRQLPYGLLFDLIKVCKLNGYEIKVTDEVKELFGNKKELIKDYNLKFPPRDYQKDIIETTLKYKKGIFVSATASGKSLIISYIFKILYENNEVNKGIIIVPTTNLITQFYEDLIDYGIDESILGKFYADEKVWDRPLVISTWQSLIYDYAKIRKNKIVSLRKNIASSKFTKDEKDKCKQQLTKILQPEYVEKMKGIIEKRDKFLLEMDFFCIDECQIAQSESVTNLTQNIQNAKYRIACTGTLPDDDLRFNSIKSYIGNVIKEYSSSYLTKEGYLNPCQVNISRLYYKNEFTGQYNNVKDDIFASEFRLNHIKLLIQQVKEENVLILVGKIKKEGQVLEEYLNNHFPEKEIVFISGKMSVKDREMWRQKSINNTNIIIIAIYNIFQAGINIPNLAHIILGSSYKDKIRILQSIGRSLRLSCNKGTSQIYDIVDCCNKFLPKHATERKKFYKREGFIIKEVKLKE